MVRRSNEAESFEWPPVKDALTSQVFEFSSRGASNRLNVHPSRSRVPPIAARPEGDPASNLPEPQQEDVLVALRHLMQQRASAAKASAQAKPLTGSRSHISSPGRFGRSRRRFADGAIGSRIHCADTVAAANLLRGEFPTDSAAKRQGRERACAGTGAGCAPWEHRTSKPSQTRVAGVSGAEKRLTTGRLVFRTDPSGAQVFVDGRLYGVTPLTLGTVVAGEHRILLKRNATELGQTVRVEPGQTISPYRCANAIERIHVRLDRD